MSDITDLETYGSIHVIADELHDAIAALIANRTPFYLVPADDPNGGAVIDIDILASIEQQKTRVLARARDLSKRVDERLRLYDEARGLQAALDVIPR